MRYGTKFVVSSIAESSLKHRDHFHRYRPTAIAVQHGVLNHSYCNTPARRGTPHHHSTHFPSHVAGWWSVALCVFFGALHSCRSSREHKETRAHRIGAGSGCVPLLDGVGTALWGIYMLEKETTWIAESSAISDGFRVLRKSGCGYRLE